MRRGELLELLMDMMVEHCHRIAVQGDFARQRSSCSLAVTSAAGSLRLGSRRGQDWRFDRCLRFFAAPWPCGCRVRLDYAYIGSIVAERHFATLCKAQDLIFVVDESLVQFFRLAFGDATSFAFTRRARGQFSFAIIEDLGVFRADLFETRRTQPFGVSIADFFAGGPTPIK